MHFWIINLFSDFPNEGAAEGRFLTLAKTLSELGHSVTWWTMDFHHRTKSYRHKTLFAEAEQLLHSNAKHQSISLRGIPVPTYKNNISFRRLYSHRAFARKLAQTATKLPNGQSPSAIIASSPPPDVALSAIQLGEFFHCPVTVDLTDLWPNTFERIFPGPKKTQRSLGSIFLFPLYRKAHRIYREANLVSAVSAEYLEKVKHIAPTQKTHLCYIGGDVRKPSLRPASESPTTHFLYVGALTQSYDLGTIIRAAAILKEKKNPFEVHFAGSGNQENSLQSLASQLGVGEICQFHGFLNSEKLKDLLDSCDVGLNCILPGLDITMPHKLSDYICSGLPVINSLPGEAQSLLVNWQCGIFYQAGNAPSLSSAMLSLAQKDQRQNASVNAQNLARNLFDRSESYLRWAERIIALNDE